VLEDFPDTLIRLGRALKVLLGADLLADFLGLLWRNRLLGGLGSSSMVF